MHLILSYILTICNWTQTFKCAIGYKIHDFVFTWSACLSILYLQWLDDGNDNEGSSEMVEKNVSTTTEGTESPKGRQPKKEIKEPCSEDEKLEESPVLGLLSENKTVKNDNKENKEVSESKIKKAIRNRAAYVKANSE